MDTHKVAQLPLLRNKKRGIIASGIFVLLCLIGFEIWVERTKLPVLTPDLSDLVYDRHGDLLTAFLSEDQYWRFPIDDLKVDPLYINMLVAYEDKRFFTHAGVDLRAMARAVSQVIKNGRIVSGGSTITMQVARLLERLETGKVSSKLRQIRVALALERVLDKQDILELYLKLAPFGGNIEGVAAASYIHFGRPASRLTPAEAALMVAIPQSPNRRNPARRNKQAKFARDKILKRVAAAGIISADELKAALSEYVPTHTYAIPRLALHLAEANRHSKIKLTINAMLQAKAENLFKNAVRNIDPYISGAVVISDLETGEIITYIGSPIFTDEKRKGYVDMARAARSPGSTLKPFIYAKAFADGNLHPNSLIADLPMRFGQYEPSNFDGEYKGMLKVQEALRLSRNIPAVAVLNKVGVNRFSALLKNAGLTLQLPNGQSPGLAIALGGVGVNLKEMVGAYATIANQGQFTPLTIVKKDVQTKREVIGANAANMVANILRQMPAPASARDGIVSYKTGTSYGHRDSWAIGFDGQHAIGVLLARADNSPVPGAFGAELAVPILFQMFDMVGYTRPTYSMASSVDTTRLPKHLKRFGQVKKPADQVKILYPPTGATVELCNQGMLLKLRGGLPPYRVFLNGRLQEKQYFQRSLSLPISEQGYYAIQVLAADGKTAHSDIKAVLLNQDTCLQ